MYSSSPSNASRVFNRFSERFEKILTPGDNVWYNPAHPKRVSSVPMLKPLSSQQRPSKLALSPIVGLSRLQHRRATTDSFQEFFVWETALIADQYNLIESAAVPEAMSAKIFPSEAVATWKSWACNLQLTPGSVERRCKDSNVPASSPDSGLGDPDSLDWVKFSGGMKDYLYYGVPVTEVDFYLVQLSPRNEETVRET
ncbi:unnamed protein product [Schistocephalus solidus]|uniref:YqaJ domain-containing protein n=1 Tax=Schistocephalus solidus TaxID=70667 RepID=A0A183SEF9_SCHSO|nr:unnamed protein product [Schistocephalus solidus]